MENYKKPVPSNSIIGLVSFSKKSEVASTQSIVSSLVIGDKEAEAIGCSSIPAFLIDGGRKGAGNLPESGSAIGDGGSGNCMAPSPPPIGRKIFYIWENYKLTNLALLMVIITENTLM